MEHLWVQRYPDTMPGAPLWRIVADDAPNLICQNTARGVHLLLVGARTTYTDINVSGRRFTVGVRLRPGALLALFGVSADELTNRAVVLEDVLGRVPAEVYDTLAAEDEHDVVRSLDSFLAERIRTNRSIDPRITTLVQGASNELATVRDAAEALTLSERTVRYWSQQHVGMGLKRLWRIRRLHRALRQGLGRSDGAWARIAAEAGYADQAHFARECRALLGEPPTVFAARAQVT